MKNTPDLTKVGIDENKSNNIGIGNGIVPTFIGKHFKKVIYLTCLTGIGLFFTACDEGYVLTEPTYVESSRPASPSSVHVWIDGDWRYNRSTHAYVRQNGYWEKPTAGRTYVSGRWQSNAKGHYWTKGHYQRQR